MSADPTGFHLDTPSWSFGDRRAISNWIAHDDATPLRSLAGRVYDHVR